MPRLVRPEVSMASTEASECAPRDGHEDYHGFADNPLAYADVCDFISRRDDSESSANKDYGSGITPSEVNRTSKLDEIDDGASNYDDHAETCVSPSCEYERTTRDESREETARSDQHRVPSLHQDRESRCRSKRRRRSWRCRTPDGIIINLDSDVARRSGIKISVISVHNLTADTSFVASAPWKRGPACKRGLASKHKTRSSTRKDSKRKQADGAVGSPVLAVFYTGNRGWQSDRGSWSKPECRSRRSARHSEGLGSTKGTSRPDVDAIERTATGQPLNERQEPPDNSRSLCASDEILRRRSTRCCHRDAAALLGADVNARASTSSIGRACTARSGCTAELCCSIFDEHRQDRREYHVCEREDYNADPSGLNAVAEAGWTSSLGCVHAVYAKPGCRCFCDSCGCYPVMDTQLDRLRAISSERATTTLGNSACAESLRREEMERFGSGEPEAASIAAELAAEVDQYSSHDAAGGRRCASCDVAEVARSSASTIRKCPASRTSVFAEASAGNVGVARDSRDADAPQRGIGEEPGRRTKRGNDEQPRKSDSPRSGFVGGCATTTGSGCVERCRKLRSDRPPEQEGGFARGAEPGRVRDSIETDAQQLDYKWKRRIATVGDGARASADFKGERDSRSQTEADDTSASDDRRRDYSLWTSLRMGRVWSQVHDACRDVTRLVATSVGRVAPRSASRSECSRRNPEIRAANATHRVDSSHGIHGEACCGNSARSQANGGKPAHTREEERAIVDVTGSRGAVQISKARNKACTSAGRGNAARKRAYQNPGKVKDEKSDVLYDEREHDEYRRVVELPPPNETFGHDEPAYPQSRLSGSSTRYLEDSAYPGSRSRGGSDDGGSRALPRSRIEDRQREAAARRVDDIEQAESTSLNGYHEISVSESCTCHMASQTCIHSADSRGSLHDEPTAISSDIPDVPVTRGDSLNREHQSVAASLPGTGKRTPQEANSDLADSEIEGDSMPGLVVEATMVSSFAEADTAVHYSRNDTDDGVTSTSTWQPTPRESQTSRASRSRQPLASNGAIAPVFKRKIRSAERKNLLSATPNDGETEITQIEPSTVQTAEEGNKRRTYVNVRMQTSAATVTRILSELLDDDEKTKRVLMSITLQSESTDDVGDRKEAETQTPSKNVISVGTDAFDCPDRHLPPVTITSTTRTVQCFACNKPDCYEIKRSDDSITLEEALIAEYPEDTLLGRDDIAERRTVIEGSLLTFEGL